MNNIIGYNKCQCGAITLYFADGTINSKNKRKVHNKTYRTITTTSSLKYT